VSSFALPRYDPRHTIYLPTTPSFCHLSTLPSRRFAFYNDFDDILGGDDDDATDGDGGNNDFDLYEDLRKRQSSLKANRQKDMQCWKSPPVETIAFPLLNDWVRRVAMDTNAIGSTATSSYAIVGGASGSLYLIDLSAEASSPQQIKERMLLGTLERIHESTGDEDLPGTSSSVRSRAIDALYGGFDGGGIVALAMQDNLVASAGREGGVHISYILDKNAAGGKNRLQAVGKIPGLDSFVTSLSFDQSGRLWVGSFDGMIRAYDLDDESSPGGSLPQQSEPRFALRADSGILHLSLADDFGCGVAATEKDGIILFSVMDGSASVLAKWNPFADYDEFARSAVIVQNDEAPGGSPTTIADPADPSKQVTLAGTASWSVVIGGSSGSLYQRRLNVGPEGTISHKRPFDDLSPIQKVPEQFQHNGPVVTLACPGPRVLLSAGQDGTIRVWDSSYQQPSPVDDEMRDEMGGSKPSFLFAMSGFKVWLGSMIVLKSNQKMLITDGADNTVIALVFKSAGEN